MLTLEKPHSIVRSAARRWRWLHGSEFELKSESEFEQHPETPFSPQRCKPQLITASGTRCLSRDLCVSVCALHFSIIFLIKPSYQRNNGQIELRNGQALSLNFKAWSADSWLFAVCCSLQLLMH